jgi:hypothetical protein
MADIDSTPTAPSASESSPNGVSPNEAVPLDLKLKIVLGNGFSVELARNRLAECSPEVVALLASKSLCPIGREAQVLIPDKSPMDNKLLATFKEMGRKDFGEVLEVNPAGLLPHRLVLGVSPRDTLRRDETKELLIKLIYHQLRVGLQSSNVIHFEAVDGNAIFAIPRAQIAEVLFDACFYFAQRFPTKMGTVRFVSTSRTLLEQYVKVFQKRYEKLSLELEELPPHNEECPPSNFMFDIYQDDTDWVKMYGMHQRQLYNDCGSAVSIDLYDAFVACERRFSRPKAPILLAQIKSYLREIQNATDMQLNAIIQRRQRECQKVVIEAFEKHKATHVEFFRALCVYDVQFCKEILVKTIKEIVALDNLFLPPSQLAKMLHRYAGEDLNEEAEASANGESGAQRAGAQRSASEIFIQKSKGNKRRSAGRPVKRRSGSTRGMSPSSSAENLGSVSGSASGASGSLNVTILDEPEPDMYQTARDRIGKDAVSNWTRVMDVLYNGGLKVTNLSFDVTQTADADKLAAALVRIFHFNDDALSLLRLAIKNEVDKTPVLSTLFRQNSMASKMLTTFSRLVSKNYLVSILSPCISKVVEAGENLEVDPSKLKVGSDIRDNQLLLKSITETLIMDICNSVDLLPYPCRAICSILKEIVEPKFPDGANVAIAGFLVLRLINPALVVPDADGLNILSKEKTAEARRGLLLVSKLIQNLANQVDFKKEEFMITFNPFVAEKFAVMEDFFLECASPSKPKASDLKPSLDVSPQLFNESLQIVSKQFTLDQAKYTSLLDMEGDILDDFKALISHPIDLGQGASNSSMLVTTTAPISLNKDDKKDKKDKKEKKEKEKDKKDKEEKKDSKDSKDDKKDKKDKGDKKEKKDKKDKK